jgi:NADP-dependent 3-hydroxy acid dehydrogenase YdfG
MERGLLGRVCVVTGASSGIGEATARAFAGGGARVVLLARRRERVQALAEELGEAALPLEADVRDLDALRAAAEQVRKRLGRVDCLVNNAGVMLNSPFRAGLVEEWRTMVETNLLGVLYATHVFVDDLCAGGGDVVNLSLVGGRALRPATNVYAATKHGVTGWSDALRQELLEHDVRVVCVEPGAVATELPEHLFGPEDPAGDQIRDPDRRGRRVADRLRGHRARAGLGQQGAAAAAATGKLAYKLPVSLPSGRSGMIPRQDRS